MSLEAVAYPFLFVAIFFESFILVTLLSAPARRARGRAALATTPSVAIIVPCWNEETTVAKTCASLLALDYPADKLEILLVDDGSTDTTRAVITGLASANPRVRALWKENGGKHTALNFGIAATNAELVGCMDADSVVEADALREITSCFANAQVAAATCAMSVHEPKTLLQHMQQAEYVFVTAARHALSSINGLYVTPGPFSFYRRAVIEELGGFRFGHQTEDMEIALRIQRAGYTIENAPRARVYTKTPGTISELLKQRTRWTSGFLRNLFGEYRSLFFNGRHEALGFLVLPVALLAIGGGIVLFLFALSSLAVEIASTTLLRASVPLSYNLLPSFDWFYFPSSAPLFLWGIVALCSLGLILFGKHISKSRVTVAFGFLPYIALYGLLVPLWLLRATADVSLGRKRGWRE
jgi:peptidoglycan-N-acetylglucosamine deacetylase